MSHQLLFFVIFFQNTIPWLVVDNVEPWLITKEIGQWSVPMVESSTIVTTGWYWSMISSQGRHVQNSWDLAPWLPTTEVGILQKMLYSREALGQRMDSPEATTVASHEKLLWWMLLSYCSYSTTVGKGAIFQQGLEVLDIDQLPGRSTAATVPRHFERSGEWRCRAVPSWPGGHGESMSRMLVTAGACNGDGWSQGVSRGYTGGIQCHPFKRESDLELLVVL